MKYLHFLQCCLLANLCRTSVCSWVPVSNTGPGALHPNPGFRGQGPLAGRGLTNTVALCLACVSLSVVLLAFLLSPTSWVQKVPATTISSWTHDKAIDLWANGASLCLGHRPCPSTLSSKVLLDGLKVRLISILEDMHCCAKSSYRL